MSEPGRLGVAVIGCGLMGTRRARSAAAHAATRVTTLVDPVPGRAEALATEVGGRVCGSWEEAVEAPETRIVVVATPNALLAEVGCRALELGRHVLVEKPMGRGLAEARRLAAAAAAADAVLKVGFNHRYHPGIAELLRRVEGGEIGRVLNVRGRYGHGGRPGLETEWRAGRAQAGGGHLLDQGVHLADLFHALLGAPRRVYGVLQTAFWPLAGLEDNAFGLFQYESGAVAQLHVSMTQWKNLFSLEVFGEDGALLVEGLGRSYGAERLVHWSRRPEGGAPRATEQVFPEGDRSWAAEWQDFAGAALGARLRSGGPEEGVATMAVLDALYRSASSGMPAEPER